MAGLTTNNLLLHLLHRAERARIAEATARRNRSTLDELRSLEFWRAIIAECLASFFYVFLACGPDVLMPAGQPLIRVLASGVGMATAVHCFSHMSGAHSNPACTLSMLVTRKISVLRASLYVIAQSGGAIAGAALLYGLLLPAGGGSGNFLRTIGCTEISPTIGVWKALALEMILTFVIVFALHAAQDPLRCGGAPVAVGLAYLSCTLVALPATGASMNPARSLGPAFVMNKWNHHWVYWCGPMAGGLVAGLIYEYVFEESSPKTFVSLKAEQQEDEDDKESNEDVSEEKTAKVVTTPVSAVPHYHTSYREQSQRVRALSRPITPNVVTPSSGGGGVTNAFSSTVQAPGKSYIETTFPGSNAHPYASFPRASHRNWADYRAAKF